MTEPSEHARRAARKILEVIPQFSDNLLYEDCITGIIDAATAELKADKDKVIEELSKWVLDGREVAFDLLSYDPCSCKHPACKRCRRQQAANKLIDATNGFVPPPISPEQKEKE